MRSSGQFRELSDATLPSETAGDRRAAANGIRAADDTHARLAGIAQSGGDAVDRHHQRGLRHRVRLLPHPPQQFDLQEVDRIDVLTPACIYSHSTARTSDAARVMVMT